MTQAFPCIMTDMYFDLDRSIKLKQLVKAVHNPEERMLWDKDIEHFEYLSQAGPEEMQLSDPSKKLLLFLLRMKSSITFIQRREFLEKKLKFKVAAQ